MKDPNKLVHLTSGMAFTLDDIKRILAMAEKAIGIPKEMIQEPTVSTAREIREIEQAEAMRRWNDYKAKHNIP